jgi:hypothetical protein
LKKLLPIFVCNFSFAVFASNANGMDYYSSLSAMKTIGTKDIATLANIILSLNRKPVSSDSMSEQTQFVSNPLQELAAKSNAHADTAPFEYVESSDADLEAYITNQNQIFYDNKFDQTGLLPAIQTIIINYLNIWSFIKIKNNLIKKHLNDIKIFNFCIASNQFSRLISLPDKKYTIQAMTKGLHISINEKLKLVPLPHPISHIQFLSDGLRFIILQNHENIIQAYICYNQAIELDKKTFSIEN